MSENYKEIEWISHFANNGYGLWARRNVEAIQSSPDFLVKIRTMFPLPITDPLQPLQHVEVKDPYVVHNYIPTYKLPDGKDGWCTCTELRKPPDEQIYTLNHSKFILALGKWCTDIYKEHLDEPEKVHTVNFPFPDRLFAPIGQTVKLNVPEQYKFKFLFVGRVDIRKNIDTLVRCFKEEFGNNKEVCLLLRLNSEGRMCTPKWLMDQRPSNNIFWMPDIVPYMGDLLRSVNAYVCTDFGEAWGGPCTEAMLCGLPTIMPNHSGHTNYGNKWNSWLIDVGDWEYIGYEKENIYKELLPPSGQVKYPKEDSIKKQMANVYEQFKDAKRKEYIHHVKIQEALKVRNITNYGYVLNQFRTAFKWISENV